MFFFTERVRVRSQQICQRRYMKGDNNIVDLCINILENIIVKCAKAASRRQRNPVCVSSNAQVAFQE